MAITWEPDFSQPCSFWRMLMNHKNFCFTQIPDKTNNVIFLKSPKTLFLGHFWPFLVIKKSKSPVFGPFLVIFAWWWFRKKSGSVTHNYIWAPNTTLSFRKKTNEPIPQKDGRTDRMVDRRPDGQTLFYRTLPAKAEGPTTFRTSWKCFWLCMLNNNSNKPSISKKGNNFFHIYRKN